jgi:hypothetical protein
MLQSGQVIADAPRGVATNDPTIEAPFNLSVHGVNNCAFFSQLGFEVASVLKGRRQSGNGRGAWNLRWMRAWRDGTFRAESTNWTDVRPVRPSA